MKRAKKQRQWAADAAIARSDLNTLYGVIALLEGGTISAHCYATTQQIIRACKVQSAKCLSRYDHAIAQIREYDA